MFTILIVEDDPKITAMLSAQIEKYGYRAEQVSDFSRVLERFTESGADLVMLDVNLPNFDGFYWCRQIRSVSTCPILFISARDSGMDQIMALENGADDYITKPFSYEVVMAKIRSHLRRAYGTYAAKQEERTVGGAGLLLYPERFTVTRGDQAVVLTQKEAVLLEALMERVGRVVTREKLLDLMWQDHHFIDDNTLNVYVTRIRKKLKELGLEDAVETVRGAGYMLLPSAAGEA